MSRLRRGFSFENVLVTVVAFVVLAGGTAIAANQLAKNSVGKKQLKAKSVTAKKIKKNAVTTAKIKNGAVTGAKVKDGTVGGGDIELESMPFSHIVLEARGGGPLAVPSAELYETFPLSNVTYTQPPGRDDTFFGAVDVTFGAGCGPSRDADAVILVDPVDPRDPQEGEQVATGSTSDEGTGTVTERINLSLYPSGRRNPTGGPVSHTLVLGVRGECESGSGISFANGAVDVVGTR